MKNADKFSKFTSAVGLIFLSVLFFLFLLYLAETGYRFYTNGKNPTVNLLFVVNQQTHVNKPYVMFTARPGIQVYGSPDSEQGRINALGYLGALPDKIKPTSEYRIFLLGGSAAFQGSPPFSVKVEKLFHQAGRTNVKVFNFSVVSSVSRQELVRIMVDIAGYQPDLIISYTGYNDLFDTVWDPRVNYPHRYLLYEVNPILKNAKDYRLLPNLALSSQYLRDHFSDVIFDQLSEGIYPKYVPARKTMRPLIAKALIQNLRLSKSMSAQLGSEYLAILQPTVFFKKNKSEIEKSFIQADDIAMAEEIRQAVHLEVRPFQNEFKFVDGSELFADEARTVFSDCVHYVNEPWQDELIARFVYENVLSSVDLNKKKPSQLPGLLPEEDFTFNPPL